MGIVFDWRCSENGFSSLLPSSLFASVFHLIPGNLSNVSLYCSISPFLSLSFIAPSRYITGTPVSLHSTFTSLHLSSPSYSVLSVCDGSKECPKSASLCSYLGRGILISLSPSLQSSLLSSLFSSLSRH